MRLQNVTEVDIQGSFKKLSASPRKVTVHRNSGVFLCYIADESKNMPFIGVTVQEIAKTTSFSAGSVNT